MSCVATAAMYRRWDGITKHIRDCSERGPELI
jgi:hypothetical protein